MANVEGNLQALREALAQIWPLHQKSTVQEIAGRGENTVKRYEWMWGSAPATWTKYDVKGYGLNFSPSVDYGGKKDPGARGFLIFGKDEPGSSNPEVMPEIQVVEHGTQIRVPQGFDYFYFASRTTLQGWTIEVLKLPNFDVQLPKYADCEAFPVTYAALDYSDSSPTVVTDGVSLSKFGKYITIQLVTKGPPISRLATTVTCEVWWYNLTTRLWCHNPSDDFDNGGLTDADATHDVEVFQVQSNFSRCFVKRTNSATLWSVIVCPWV